MAECPQNSETVDDMLTRPRRLGTRPRVRLTIRIPRVRLTIRIRKPVVSGRLAAMPVAENEFHALAAQDFDYGRDQAVPSGFFTADGSDIFRRQPVNFAG